MRVLVCGGRDFGRVPNGCPSESLEYYHRKAQGESTFLRCTLDTLHVDNPITEIIHGAAKGADTIAKLWARRMAIKETPFPANWLAHGAAAGPIRNRRMLDEGKPDVVVAFPGGKGTSNMVSLAEEYGIRVICTE